MKIKPQPGIFFGFLFWLSFFILVVFIYGSGQFADINFKQQKSDYIFPIYDEAPISQTVLDIKVDSLVFFPSVNKIANLIRHPLNVYIEFHNSGIIQHKKCPSFWIILRHQCKISGFQKQVDQKNPATITFITDAPQNTLGIWGSQTEGLLEGKLVVAGEKQDGALEFFGYNQKIWINNLQKLITNWFVFISFTVVTFFIGLGPMFALNFKKGSILAQDLLVALFLGVAFIIIISTVSSWFNISLVLIQVFFYLFTVISLIWVSLHLHQKPEIFSRLSRASINWGLLAAFLFAGLIGSWQISEVRTPLWVDGLFHYHLIEDVLEINNLSTGTIYPTGFHGMTIFFHHLFGLNTYDALLLTGQWINIISGLSFYLFAQKLLGAGKGAWISTLIFWFFSPFPDYLLNWSRFPFAFGLALLPLGLFSINEIFKNSKDQFLLLIWLFLIATVHYGVFILLLAGLMAWLITYRPDYHLSKDFNSLKKKIARLVPVLLVSLIYLTYRLLTIINNRNWESLILQTQNNANDVDYGYAVGLLLQQGGLFVFLIALIGVIVLLKTEKQLLKFTTLWLIFSVLAILLQKLLIGASILSVVNLLYFLPILACLAGGAGIDYLNKIFSNIIRTHSIIHKNNFYVATYKYFTAAFLIISCLYAGYHQISILNPKVVMVTQTDVDAFDWIQSNTTSEAKFLVNTFEWGNSFKPVDGGGWIPAMTDRQAYHLSVKPEKSNMQAFIKEKEIEYVYFKLGSGLLDVAWMENNPIVYQNKGILIYSTKHLLNNAVQP